MNKEDQIQLRYDEIIENISAFYRKTGKSKREDEKESHQLAGDILRYLVTGSMDK